MSESFTIKPLSGFCSKNKGFERFWKLYLKKSVNWTGIRENVCGRSSVKKTDKNRKNLI